MRRGTIGAALVALLVTAGVSTGAAAAPPPPVELTLTAVRTPGGPEGGPKLRLEGTANVPDRAWIAYEVTLPNCDLGCFIDGRVRVRDGRFTKTVKLPVTIDAAASPGEAWVAFQPIDQPKKIFRRYGKLGQKVTGIQVVEAGKTRRAELVTTFPDESAL